MSDTDGIYGAGFNDGTFNPPGTNWEPIGTAPIYLTIDLWSEFARTRFAGCIFYRGKWMQVSNNYLLPDEIIDIPYQVTHWRLILGPKGVEM